MKNNKPSTRFWLLLGLVNLFAIVYPVHLLRRAADMPETLLATVVLMVVFFLLAVADLVSIFIAVGSRG
jgi:uncharacterized membrane protein